MISGIRSWTGEADSLGFVVIIIDSISNPAPVLCVIFLDK